MLASYYFFCSRLEFESKVVIIVFYNPRPCINSTNPFSSLGPHWYSVPALLGVSSVKGGFNFKILDSDVFLESLNLRWSIPLSRKSPKQEHLIKLSSYLKLTQLVFHLLWRVNLKTIVVRLFTTV